MSRIELDAIQNKLKTAIQNHQILVKTKGDQQNVAFKSCLKELQEEIKRLSEEQKKIVVKLRESLVKSSQPQPPAHQQQPQPQQPQQPPPTQTTVVSVIGGNMSTVLDPQTVSAAISQSRLMYPAPQGGATILPVGMVAVPLAHVQHRPTLGVTFNGGRGQICTPTGNITLQPGDYANAVVAAAAAQLPTGLQSSNTINIPINNNTSSNTVNIPINNCNNTTTNIALQNSIAINNITNAINVSSLNGNIVNGSINIAGLSNPHAGTLSNLNTIMGSAGVAGHSIGSIVIGPKTLTQLNNNNVALTTVVNSQSASSMTPTQNGANHTIPLSHPLGSTVSVSPTQQGMTLANGGATLQPTTVVSSTLTTCVTVASHYSTTSTVAKDQPSMAQPLQIPQQPHHQPQTIPPHQQLGVIATTSANFPIRVPRYTASPTRTTYCSIAPAPAPAALPTPPTRQSMVPTTAVSSTNFKKQAEAVVKPVTSKISTLQAPTPTATAVIKGKMAAIGTTKSDKMSRGETCPPTAKPSTSEQDKKHEFMKALDLYAPEMLKDLLHKRNERKRRTTANPHYSIGFQSRRWQRNETITEACPFKKAKVGKERKPITKTVPTDSQHKKDKMSDSHDDFCAACGKGGQLLMCETCRLVYHLDCLKPPLTQAPSTAWSCPKCLVSGKGSANLNSEALSRVHSYIGKRIAKEDEKKKQQRKGADIRNEKSFLDNRSKKLESEMKDQHNSKRKLEDKDKLCRKELDQLVGLMHNVQGKNSSRVQSQTSPKAGPRHTTVPEIQMSLDSLPTPLSVTVPVIASTALCKDSENSVNKENNLIQKDPSPVSAAMDDDRIVLEFKVSAKEFCEIENNSSKNCLVAMDSDTSVIDSISMETEDHSVSASLTTVCSSVTSTPQISSPAVMNSCGESLKQTVVMAEQKNQQLPITS